MMRRTRAFLPLCVLLLPLAVACSGENIPPATGPAHQTPTATESPEPSPTAAPTAASTATATPVPTPSPSPTATATPGPEPTPPPSPQPTATPTPPATEYLPLTMGEPRALPAGTALYARSYGSCEGPQDWHRGVATDTHELLWDEPLSELPHGGDLGGVSASGNTLAAVSCERGVCMSIDGASDDAINALWVSGNGGETWERWGEIPTTYRGISLVTGDDVALEVRWPEHRAWWYRSGEDLAIPRFLLVPRIWAWRGSGARPEPFWPDGEGTALVSASGERLPRPWDFLVAASLPDGSILWRSNFGDREALGRDMFLRLDEQGARLGAYSWDSPRPLAVLDHLEGQLLFGMLGPFACLDTVRPVLVDLESRTVHPIPGLDDREGFVPFAARPPPLPTETTRPAVVHEPLTMGEPRALPAGTALYFRQYHSCHGPQDWLRAITTDTGELAWDDPLGELPRRSDDDYWDAASLEGVSASGQTLAAWVCERGYCGSIERERSEDAVESLWVSGDGGESWERWGDYPRGRVSIVTEEDVAFMSNWSWSDDYQARAWWVRSGEELVPPEWLAAPTLLGWRLDREAPEPIWADSELTVLVSPSGERLGDPGLVQERDFEAGRWLASHHYGPTLWRAVLDAYSFDEPLAVFDHVEGQFFVGLLGGYACGDSGLTVLVDFTSGTVHPIPGLDAREGFVPFAARPAPD